MNVIRAAAGIKDAWAHAFRTGATVTADLLADKDARKAILTHFSSLESASGWDADETADIARFARKNGLTLRCAPLIPGAAPSNGSSRETRLADAEKRLSPIADRYGDVIATWDVLGEAPEESRNDELGFYRAVFERARAALPQARLMYFDRDIAMGSRLEATLGFLGALVGSGTPIHGVTLGGPWAACAEDSLRMALARYASLGLEIELSGIDALPESKVAAIFRVAADYPAVRGLTFGNASASWFTALFGAKRRPSSLVSTLIDSGFNLTD